MNSEISVPLRSDSISPESVFYQFCVKTKLPENIAKVVDLCPELLIGSQTLFLWNSQVREVTLSKSFKSLLKLLYQAGTFDLSEDCQTIEDLNKLLQHPQNKGGLLRVADLGKSRSDIVDLEIWQPYRPKIEKLLGKLGYICPIGLQESISVDHCLIFGMKVDRMITRIQETVELLNKGLLTPKQIYLLGAKRALNNVEKETLASELEKIVDTERQTYWKNFFALEENKNEGDAFIFLWERYGSENPQYKDLVKRVHSKKLGTSSQENVSYRATTQVTTDDWTLKYYNDHLPQKIFASIEQPFRRLPDQLRSSVLTNANRASVDELIDRIRNTTFHFVITVSPDTAPLCLGLRFDEIARNVYRTVETINYLEKVCGNNNLFIPRINLKNPQRSSRILKDIKNIDVQKVTQLGVNTEDQPEEKII